MKKVVKELPIFKYIEDPIENEIIEDKYDNCEKLLLHFDPC